MSEKATANKLYDADAPFLVESYQHGAGSFQTQESLPSYSYSNDPHMPGQLRSWDDAARAPPVPIRSPNSGPHGHVYANVDSDNPYLGVGGAPSVTPAPLNATITGYATGLGWELSKLCAIAYAIPPFSSVLLLLYETQNDLVRFHAYQAGFGGAIVVVGAWILNYVFGLRWLVWLLTRLLLFASWYCGYVYTSYFH
ncbi:hypothetical protein MGL_0776 [Malassezia globosa CBS 7966]|uniref:Uncharacterized protein n=1 Tax=Malassezia globosa (strain ATCC MYA-4612 / CBS 7966) TaxID=425265 RepID=A8PUU7_MALGO|nr:uncharacterized protein MGL_0776 [Malassezia globosa CBS 7966]EDP44969.1 hypothetical protein MGL_0776 [Malassezia globosa CBS 7966]